MTHTEPQARQPLKTWSNKNSLCESGKQSLVQSGKRVGIRLSEGAVYFKPWLWEGMQSKVNNNGHSLGAPVNMMENRFIPIVMA